MVAAAQMRTAQRRPNGICIDCGGSTFRGYWCHPECKEKYRASVPYREETLAAWPANTCAKCGRLRNWWHQRVNPGRQIDVDHKRPVARGGNSSPVNLEPLCHFPHHAKKTRRDLAAMAWERASIFAKAGMVLRLVGRPLGRGARQQKAAGFILMLAVAFLGVPRALDAFRGVGVPELNAEYLAAAGAALLPWLLGTTALIVITVALITHLRAINRRTRQALIPVLGETVKIRVHSWTIKVIDRLPRLVPADVEMFYSPAVADNNPKVQEDVENRVKAKYGWSSARAHWNTGRDRVRISTPDPFVASAAVAHPGFDGVGMAIPIGLDQHGSEVIINLAEKHLLIGGETGSGKSNTLSIIIAGLAANPNVDLFLADGKKGMEQKPWVGCAEDLALTRQHFVDMLDELISIMDMRSTLLAAEERRKIEVGKAGEPNVIILVIDELADLIGGSTPEEMKVGEAAKTRLIRLIALGRAVGIIIVAATQRPSAKLIDADFRDQFSYRLGHRITTPQSSDMILGQGWSSLGYSLSKIDPRARGGGYVLASREGDDQDVAYAPRLFRSYYISDEDLRGYIAAATAVRRAEVDRLLRAEPAPVPDRPGDDLAD